MKKRSLVSLSVITLLAVIAIAAFARSYSYAAVEPMTEISLKSEETRVEKSEVIEKKILRQEFWNDKEKQQLLQIAMAEAEGEGVLGKALVIKVVLNRVESEGFPDTIEDVIYQPYQFTPIIDGRFDSCIPDQECHEALDLIAGGWDESQNALFFESPSASTWHRDNLEFLFQYGNHLFYK